MLELQCCTRLSSTVVTLLIMLVYWCFFDDCLNLLQLAVSAEPLADNTIVQKLEACRRTHSNGLTGDCSHLAASYWHRYYPLKRDVSSLTEEKFFTNHQWSITKTLCFLMVVVSMIVGLLSAAALGSLLTIAIFLKSGKKYQLRTRMPSRLKALYTLKKSVSLTNPLGRSCCCCPASCSSSRVTSPDQAPPLSSQCHHSPGCERDLLAQEVVSRPVDAALASLLDTALECELLPWYRLLVMDTKPALGEIRKCAWHVVSRLAELGRAMDGVGFLTGGVAACLTRHLQRIRLAQQAGEKAGERGVLELVPQLSSPERERNFLRRLAEYLLLHTLPRSSYDCLPLRTVLRELLACKILEVCVDVVCSPDWINQQIVFLLPKQPAQKQTALPKTPTGGVATGKSSLSSSAKLLLGDSEAGAGTMPGLSGGGSGNYGRFIRLLLPPSSSGGGCVEGDEGGIEQLVAVIQACTDEEKLEAARQSLHKELLLCTTSSGAAAGGGGGGTNKESSTNSGEAAGAGKDVSASHSGLVADREAPSINGVAAPVPSIGGWRNLTGSKQQREHKVVVGEWPAAFCERGVSEMTRARAECERRLLAVKAGLADIGDHADKMFPSTSFSSVLESAFCRRHLHHYLQSLQAAPAGNDEDPINADACGKGVDATDAHKSDACDTLKGVGTLTVHREGLGDLEEEEGDSIGHIDDDDSCERNITVDQKGTVMAETPKRKVATSCSGVAALGLYCSLQELLGAPCRSHEALITQIYYTYFSPYCTHPVPIDEVVQQHIWQLVLAGSRGVGGADGACAPAISCSRKVGGTPLIGCLAGAVEEVGQFLQTRYSAGFLHSSHYRTMMAEATVMGHHIATGTSSLDVLTKTSGLVGLGPPCTLQQQLHYAQSTLALHQERQTYKTWAMNSLSSEEENIIKKCRREVDEASKMSRQYETHLHTLQLWIDNFGKWRIHVQGVETTEEKENPEIILLVSLDDESPVQSCLQAPSPSSTPSPQYPRSPQLARKSPQPPRSPIPPPRSPQHRSKPTQGHSTISSMANSVIYTTLSAISTATADSLPPLSEKLSPGSYEETSSCLGNSDALKGSKSKSLSFEKDYNGAAVVPDASEKSSTSLDKLSNLPGKSRCSSSSSSEKHPGTLVKSKGSMEKSSDSLKSKSSTGSLERLIGNFSGSLSKSSSCCSSDQAPSFASSSAATATAETAGDSDETFAGGGGGGRGLTVVDHRDDMDGWVVVRRLTHFTDIHKKLCMYWPSLKSREVPSLPSKSIFSKASGSERACLERLRAACQRYLSALTWDALDPGPARSLLFYELVCPTQHLLWRPQPAVPAAKKSKFSLSSFFKGREGRGDSDGEDDPSPSSLTEPLSRRLAAFADTASAVTSATPSSGASASGGAVATSTAAVTKQEQRSTTASIASQLFGGDKILSKSCEIDVVACGTTAEERDTVGASSGDLGLEDIKAGGGVVVSEKSSVSDKVDGIFGDWKTAGRSAMSFGTEKQSLLSAVANSNNWATDKPNWQGKASDRSGNSISRAASAESDKQVPQNNTASAKGSSGVAFGRGPGNSSTTSGGSGVSGKVPTSGGKPVAGGGVHGASGGEAVVAEPLFALLEELCELRGMGKLIRKTLVTFVQMTYGKNITKHVRETASGLLSEEMMVRYISALEKGLWPEPHTSLLQTRPRPSHEQRPNESTATHYQRTHKQISDTRQEARAAILAAVPASLGTLVGASSATRGAHRLFAALQHHALNKNLFYNILEELLQEVFPELREKMESAAQH